MKPAGPLIVRAPLTKSQHIHRKDYIYYELMLLPLAHSLTIPQEIMIRLTATIHDI